MDPIGGLEIENSRKLMKNLNLHLVVPVLLVTLNTHADPKRILAKACAAAAVQTSTSMPIPTIDKCEISSRLAALKSLQAQQTKELAALKSRQTKELVDTEILIDNCKKEALALEQELARRDFLENPIPPILIMGGACFIGAVMVTGGAAGIAGYHYGSYKASSAHYKYWRNWIFKKITAC